MAAKALPSQSLLLQLLRYDPETGKLFWRERPASMFALSQRDDRMGRTWNTRYAHKEALTAIGTHGYRSGSIGKAKFLAHRVIWKLVTGEEPEQIDHINHIRLDNRLANLRASDVVENARNMTRRRDNSSGVTGVHWHKPGNKWRAQIKSRGGKISLGLFDEFDQAVAARRAAEVEYGFHENHGR